MDELAESEESSRKEPEGDDGKSAGSIFADAVGVMSCRELVFLLLGCMDWKVSKLFEKKRFGFSSASSGISLNSPPCSIGSSPSAM